MTDFSIINRNINVTGSAHYTWLTGATGKDQLDPYWDYNQLIKVYNGPISVTGDFITAETQPLSMTSVGFDDLLDMLITVQLLQWYGAIRFSEQERQLVAIEEGYGLLADPETANWREVLEKERQDDEKRYERWFRE